MDKVLPVLVTTEMYLSPEEWRFGMCEMSSAASFQL